jgi:hypothetical protein
MSWLLSGKWRIVQDAFIVFFLIGVCVLRRGSSHDGAAHSQMRSELLVAMDATSSCAMRMLLYHATVSPHDYALNLRVTDVGDDRLGSVV